MAHELIASRYAQAAFETAKEAKELEPTLEQPLRLGELLRDHAELRELLFNPDVDPPDKLGIVERLLKDGCSGLVRSFLQVVLTRGRAEVLPAIIEAFRQTLAGNMPDKAFQAFALTLPSELYISNFLAVIDPDAVHAVKRFVQKTLAGALKGAFLDLYAANQDSGPYRPDQEAIGRRSLKNTCLAYLMELEDREVRDLCLRQFREGGNMTDVLAALVNLANSGGGEREEALAAFYGKWQDDALVVDKWLAIQAGSRLPDTLEKVKALMEHVAFNIRNPNKVRSLIGTFAANPVRFHDAGGAGYAFLADQVLAIDPLNPQIASRLALVFTNWKRYDERRQLFMQAQLERILSAPQLSRDLYEIVSKSLA